LFLNTFVSFQLTLTGTGNNKSYYRYDVYRVPVVVWLKLQWLYLYVRESIKVRAQLQNIEAVV